jgi:hypothetical protein
MNKKEYFDNKDTSSSENVSEGSSEYYGWGYSGINNTNTAKRKCPVCDNTYIDNNTCNIVIDDRNKCKLCDITQNKDIDKYVLKSSVPPCPDMSNYATKSMVNSCPDMDKYILKSKIPEYCSAHLKDNDKYMLKTQCFPKTHIDQITKNSTNYISKENCIRYKNSWIQDFEQWWKAMFGIQSNNTNSYPKGYGYSPYAGYGTDNPGYALDGGSITMRR